MCRVMLRVGVIALLVGGRAVLGGDMRLQVGDVPLTACADLGDSMTAPLGDRPVVVVFDGPVSKSARESTTSLGGTILEYIPDHALLVRAEGVTASALRRVAGVTRVVAFERAWTIDPRLGNVPGLVWTDAEARAIVDRGLVPIDLWFFSGTSLVEARAAVRSIPGVEEREAEDILGQWRLAVNVPVKSAGDLILLDHLQWAEPSAQIVRRSLSTVRWTIESMTPLSTPLYAHGVHGEGQILGVIDGPVSTTNCAFADVNPIGPLHRKLLAYNATIGGYDPHGTLVACIAAGDAGVDDNTRGVAYASRIVYSIWPAISESSVFSKLTTAHAQGARIHTNSWGDDSTGTYTGMTRAVDAFLRAHEDDVVLFAISNTPILGNPENAKSAIAVAATLNGEDADFRCMGATGPTTDGRRKPDMLAPGCSISGSASNGDCLVGTQSGTSMATPAVAGAITLARQYFMSGFTPSGVGTPSDSFTPSGALLKAVVVNSAVNLISQPGYPSNEEGWGRVVVGRSLPFAGDGRRLWVRDVRTSSLRAFDDAGQHEYRVHWSPTTSEESLQITLAFTDAPAGVGAASAPVNDLDLEVVSPMGSVYRGNVFTSGSSVTGGTADAINSVEQVLISSPVPGDWTVRVVASAVNVGPQGYALVATGAEDALADVSCASDTNLDGGVTIDDLILYLSWFDVGVVEADVNHDAGVTIDDLLDYLAAFSNGC